jgi:hypothetical protein
MSDPTPLLVPMAVQALLVNGAVQTDTSRPFQRWSTDYSALNVFTDPTPASFADQENPPAVGVHLHWKLPAAFTHGQAEESDKPVIFPFIPNRWLVGRLATASGAAAPTFTAWIIQSDYLDPKLGTSPFAHPFNSKPGQVELTQVGRNMPYEQWQTEPGGTLFLRATGLADVTFTAYQPGLVDVLSFHDDVAGIAEDTMLTYWVCGWYSDPAQDLLATSTPAALNWSVLGDAGATPAISVVHGLVHGLQWQTTVPTKVDPDASSMKVAVGYTAVDALAAILDGGQSGGATETQLQAFQYAALETLDDPDGLAQLELRVRRAWFGSTPGGLRWKIVPVSQAQTTDDPIAGATIPPPFSMDENQAAWLANLNVIQRNYDREARKLQTMQWELFALWWKSQRCPAIISDPLALTQQEGWGIEPSGILKLIQDALDATKDGNTLTKVTNQQAVVAGLKNQLPDPTSAQSLDSFAAQIPDNVAPPNGPALPLPLALRAAGLPAFQHPADPVVLVAGMTPPSNDVDDSVALPCRTLDAAITGVTLNGATVNSATGTLASVMGLPTAAALPAPVAAAAMALAIETFFVDPTNATPIVQAAGADPGAVPALKAGMAAGTAQVSSIPQPMQAAFAFASWTQAWSPLFLQWEIIWSPTVAGTPSGDATPPASAVSAGHHPQQDNWAFLQSGWQFDGSDGVTARGSEYYGWTGGDIWPAGTGVPEYSYVGRTFLTPHAIDLFLERLATYVTLHPDDTELKTIEGLIEAIGESHFLSQTLSGFNDAFVMRGLSQSSPPAAGTPIAAAIDTQNRGVPAVVLGDQNFRWGGGNPFFFPVRGGFFRFNRLVIVDAFGQALDLLYANGNAGGDAAVFQPIRGGGLVPDANSGLATPDTRIRQAPRIVQPSRLDLRLLDADDDTKELFYAPDADPVCGWLLPNHLDRSIAVYDTSGTPLGELIVLADETGEQVTWLPAPDVANPITDPSQIANLRLRGVTSAFIEGTDIAPADRVAAFRAFYASIDETLWTVDPPGGQADHDLAALIGRPLAVVRAQLQFELFGCPAVNQSWRDTLQGETAGLTGFSFPIRLGSVELLNDGLIGYFQEVDYSRFNAVHASASATAPYVVPVVPNNYLSLPFNYPTYSTIQLTMLIDPRGKIHATTGLLPAATLELPPEYYAKALSRMGVTFRVGPVLTQSDVVRLPIPAERDGSWTWIRHTGPGTGPADWEIDQIVAADGAARLADTPPRLIDGWLKFTPNKSL